MSSKIRKKQSRRVCDSQYPPSEHVENVIEGEDFRTFETIRGAEIIDNKHCLNLDCMETDQLEDTLKQQVDENFISIKERLELYIKDVQACGHSKLQTAKIAEVFKVLFDDDVDETRFFLKSRFYYGSQAPSPIEKLNLTLKNENLAYKEENLADCLSLIKETFLAIEQGAHF